MWSETMSKRRFIGGVTVLTGAILLADAPLIAGAAGGTLAPSGYSQAAVNEIVLELVSTAENSTTRWAAAYPYIEDIGDGRGYTAGIVGWCSGTGDMLELVRHYTSTTPANLLRTYIPALQTIMAAPYARRPGLSRALLGSAFTTAWASAARTPSFQAAQRAERDRVYWNPAIAAAKRDGLSPLGTYVYYDISVNHGPGNDSESFGGIIAGVKARGGRSPAQGGNEVTYLRAIVAARSAVLRGWGDYQLNGRSSIALKFLNEGNLELRLPLRWTVYGDAFSITTVPATATALKPSGPKIGSASPGVVGGISSATARWTPPTSNGGSVVTGYTVTALRMNTAGGVLSRTTSVVQAPSRRWTTMMLPAANYRFFVRARNSMGFGLPSARSSLVTAR